MINKYLNKYLNIKYQVVEFDTEGLVISVSDDLLPVQVGSNIFEVHPFFELIKVLFLDEVKEEFFEAVNFEFLNKIVDIIFSKGKDEQGPFLIIVDKTEHYTYIQELTQMKNEVSIQNYMMSVENLELLTQKGIKNEFLLSISNDLRTPIHSIVNLLQMFDKNNLTYEQRELCKTIHDSSKHLNRLITDVYELASIDIGSFSLQEKAFNFLDLLGHIEKIYLRKLVSQDFHFVVEKQGKLPEVVIGDFNRVLQVLINIIDKACEQVGSGDLFFEIQSVYKKALNLGISFVLKANNVKAEEFNWVSFNDKKAIGETVLSENLDLAFVVIQNLLIQLGGKVKMEVSLEKGLRVETYIPFKLPRTNSNSGAISQFKRKKLKRVYNILIIDDHEINKLILMKLLINHGNFYINIAETLDDVLGLLSSDEYDFILIDLNMKNKMGYEILKELKMTSTSKIINKISLVPMTTSMNDFDKKLFKDLGINKFLMKPFLSDDLYKIIYSLI